MARKKEQTAEQAAKMQAALDKAFPKNENPETKDPEECVKPKKTYHRKTKDEKAEIARKADEERKEKEEKRLDVKAKLLAQKVLKDTKQAVKEGADQAKFIEKNIEKVKDQVFKEERERVYTKFNCPDLIRLFGGWFTLTYAFSVKETHKFKGKTIETEKDYYICSQDVSHLSVNERPSVNKIIQKEYGKTVYGFALVAPAAAFGEGGVEI